MANFIFKIHCLEGLNVFVKILVRLCIRRKAGVVASSETTSFRNRLQSANASSKNKKDEKNETIL